ncbi:MAG: hypothetical protein M1830_004823 [Pleopsidium flavum]|nr:MAG: hypothetical protein M1830_004823 [Pleopsidium flavum]
MSGVEVLAVFSCVGAIVSAFHGGSELLEHIKEKRKAKKALRNSQTENLEDSLARGPPTVQGEYDQDFRRFGAVFAVGDKIATDALKDIVITLQMTLLQNLQLAWRQDTMVDFTILKMRQKILPFSRITTRVTPIASAIESSGPVTPITISAPAEPSPTPKSVPPDSGRWPTEKIPAAAKLSLFRRPKSDTAVTNRISQELIVPRYLSPAISADKADPGWLLKEVDLGGRDRARESTPSAEISSDASSSIFEPNDLWQDPWEMPDGLSKETAVQDRRPSTSVDGPLRGAWKMQSGMKKAITERQRPHGMFTAMLYWRCQKCIFEGRMTMEKGSKRKTYDTQVHNSNGIQWRWLFLYESHVSLNDVLADPVNCIVGRVAEVGEDFDINLPPRGEGGA